jgi:hypothetical protein
MTQQTASRGAIAIAQASAFIVAGIFPRDRDAKLVEIDHYRK